MKTRFAITHVAAADGLRVLSRANQGRNHFDTEQAGRDYLAAMLDPQTNRPGVLRSVFGPHYLTTMRVEAVECYDHGDAVGAVLDYLPEYDTKPSAATA